MRPCVTPSLRIRDAEFGGPKPLFCIPLVARDLPDLMAQVKVAKELQADVVEWRADHYADFSVSTILEAAHALRRSLEQPILFTARIASEGGAKEIAPDIRSECIVALLKSAAIDLVDVELLSSADFVTRIVDAARAASKHVVISFHDFQSTPSNEVLLEKIGAMVRQGASIAKIACMPQGPGDVLRLLEVTLAARRAFPGVPLCTTSMSALGLLSRVAGFLYGSDMAFAAGAASSAPGQISITEARALTESLLGSRVVH